MSANPVLEATSVLGRARGFLSGASEIDDAPVDVQGRLPTWLAGSLLLNGPALWELSGGRFAHWFDGYSMWHALHIDARGVRYRSRFAQSDSFRRSRQAGAPVYGEFGSPNPASLLRRLVAPAMTDNPAVVMSRHGERWLSVTESPLLTYFDPVTLETIERVDLGRTGETMHLMSAHGFALPDGSYLNVGTELGPKCTMKLFRLAPGATRPTIIARIKVPKAGYMHGCALAPGHALVWETALRAYALAFRFGSRAYVDNFDWDPAHGSAIHAVALDTGEVRSWRIPPMMAFHATQGWADGRDLVLEIAIYEGRGIMDDLFLDRRRADLPLRSVARHARYRLRDGHGEAEPVDIAGSQIELQQVHPDRIGRGRASVCWGTANGERGEFVDRIDRIDLDSGEVTTWRRDGAIHLEPLFVPRPGGSADDDGVLLVSTLAAGDETTVVGVVDARTMETVAELRTPQIVPFGFHSAFRPATT